MARPINIPGTDGYSLGGYEWRRALDPERPHPLVIVNAATSVRCRYYTRFAEYLHSHGFDVLTYDYRGIGESRNGSLRGLCADWIDWGVHDFEGVLRYVLRHFPGQPIDVVGHSVGGFVIGMAASSHCIRRIFTMGAQFAFWRDYAPSARRRMYWQWHVAMPLLARMFGYVPAKRLGWMEDTPKGVALNWSQMGPCFERTLGKRRAVSDWDPGSAALARRFEGVTAPMLALGMEDDPFGTVPAMDRLLNYYVHSDRHHLRLAPDAIGEPSIGHFGFFNERFSQKLWPIALHWLLAEQLPAKWPGTSIMHSAEVVR